MNTILLLTWLQENNADLRRINLAARAVLAKVIMSLPVAEVSQQLIVLRESI